MAEGVTASARGRLETAFAPSRVERLQRSQWRQRSVLGHRAPPGTHEIISRMEEKGHLSMYRPPAYGVSLVTMESQL
jgi:hypothetical protein